MFQVYYKIFCAARKIVLEERRAQSHLESHCHHLDIEPLPVTHHHATSVAERQLNSDSQTTHGSPPVKHRSSSASTTVSTLPIDS